MNKNIVLFGPPHVGKSTLIGYLWAKYETDFEFNRFILNCKQNLANEYDDSQKFAYIVDTADIERKRSYKKTEGTSKYIHTVRISKNDYDIVIIDTPGAQIQNRERTKGMYFGDIGIFMIELSKLVKEPTNMEVLSDFFTPIFLWLKFKDKRKIIIAISKMDEREFSKKKYAKAVKIIERVLEHEDVEFDIIPISIDIKKEVEHNILSKSEKMQWYLGPTLIKKIEDLYQLKSIGYGNKPLFITIDKFFDGKKAWRGKILQGSLKKDSILKITPVKYKGKGYVNILAKIRNIRLEKGEDVEIAESGEIVGIDLNEIQSNNTRIQKKDFETLLTSCIVDKDTPLGKGTVLKFEVPMTGDIVTNKFHLLESITIIWFGRLLTSIVVHKKQTNNTWIIFLELNKYLISMPMINDRDFFFDKFLLKKKNKFIPGILKSIGTPDTITVAIDDIEDKNDVFECINEYKYEPLDGNRINIHCHRGFESLIQILRKHYKFEDISSKINISIKETKELW